MNSDVKQIINQWKVDRSAIKEDSQTRTVVRFYIPMPAPKTEMGVTVVFSYNNSNQYAIDFLTDDIVRLNSSTKPFIDNLLNNYADVFALAKKILPEMFDDACWIIRELGNSAAHAENKVFYKAQVEQTIDFVKTIINYLYVLPEKMKNMREIIQLAKNNEKSVR